MGKILYSVLCNDCRLGRTSPASFAVPDTTHREHQKLPVLALPILSSHLQSFSISLPISSFSPIARPLHQLIHQNLGFYRGIQSFHESLLSKNTILYPVSSS
ncbi:hypothetical protein MRB53_036016 [Persea americana]|uniref:Uncharacterized protein n=1 Tax=Persea americana TaxID=3435 RepID=A0ACC2K692_PERAE|nr:hypothetical protein MRB53_036016 [Persea americana]|eukprot:TRINITY_DN1300_c1_g6_i1.p2 TRINITY_DN1300_c1_g6~~TRINITY_DN1300_c1_g6_i1.p2  ORF type:complete len:102 (+),score=3.94 TRINITY_DN1300_c1_g6_i1:185-490(+)